MKVLAKTMITVLCLSPALSMAQNNFTLKVKMSPAAKAVKAYLVYEPEDEKILDSALVTNGAFQFTGKVESPVKAVLVLDHDGSGFGSEKLDFKPLYLDNENILVNGTEFISKSKISGSMINKEFERYDAVTAPFIKQYREILDMYNKAPAVLQSDTSFMKACNARIKIITEKEMAGFQEKYVKENTDSYFSLEALKEISQRGGFSVAEPLFNLLSPGLKASVAGKEFEKQIARSHINIKVGAMAIDFMQNDVNGKPVKLSDFRGKYVLLDFWASWCAPCRSENPNVVKAYQAYKDKNFTILSVSLDKEKEDWLKAIADDGLTWTHVSDLKGWKNAASTQYGVKGIPANFLIDPQGKIVATDLREEELDKKLKELLN